MMLRAKLNAAIPVVRPRVTPNPDHAAELQRRFHALTYRPACGFHRDQIQSRRNA